MKKKNLSRQQENEIKLHLPPSFNLVSFFVEPNEKKETSDEGGKYRKWN